MLPYFSNLDSFIKYKFKLFLDAEEYKVTRNNLSSNFRELRNIAFSIDPLRCLHSFSFLKPNLAFSIVDILDQLAANNPGLAEHYLPEFPWHKYKNVTGRYDYTYGERFNLNSQLENAISRLKQDSNTRQALISIWDPCSDSSLSSWNVPCTISHHILVRSNTLELTVYYRSCDAFGGFQHDMYFSSFFAQLYASLLDCKLGKLNVYIDSFHVYEDNYNRLLNLVNEIDENKYNSLIYDKYDPVSLVDINNMTELEVLIPTLIELETYIRQSKKVISVDMLAMPELLKEFIKVIINHNTTAQLMHNNEFEYWRKK